MLRKTVIPIPPAMKTYGRSVSAGRTNSPFGCSTSTSVPTGSSASERLNAVSRRRVARPSAPRSFGEVATEMWRRGPFSSSYGGSSRVSQKYWPARKSTSSPSRSKRTKSVPFATSRFSLIVARIPDECRKRGRSYVTAGSSTVKVEPVPGTESTEIVPPMRASSSRVM